MRRLGLLLALFLASSCTDSGTALEAVSDQAQTTVTSVASPTTDPDLSESMEEGDDGVAYPEIQNYVCSDGTEFGLSTFESEWPDPTAPLLLSDGSEVLPGGEWIEVETGFIDSRFLEFERKTALRFIDQSTGDEQVCLAEGADSAPAAGTQPANITSCWVNPPWGVMGGQQVVYKGERGDSGVVEVHRNGAPFTTLSVSVTWDQLLAIRQAETSETPTPDAPVLFGSPDQIFFSDFGSPSGELSYALIVRDDAGAEVQRAECGSVVVPSLAEVTCTLDLYEGWPRLSVSGVPFPEEVRRNGEVIEFSLSVGGLLDSNAPSGVPLEYEVTVSGMDPGVPMQTVQCGSIEARPLPLDQRLRSQLDRIGPAFWYGEMTPICAECDATPMHIGWEAGVAYLWEEGEFSIIVGSTQPWFTSPADVPRLLLDAIEAGREVDATFDGLEIAQWTIDGEGASYRCLGGDTAPIEIRQNYQQAQVDECEAQS